MKTKNIRNSNQEWGMRQYFCWSKSAHAHYVALSVFHDLFAATYTKPIYIEKCSYTVGLRGRCQERRMSGRDFYSLMKTPNGIYRFNADIYQDAYQILGLPIENSCSLGLGLMKICHEEVIRDYSPGEAFLAATEQNQTLRAAVSFVSKHLDISEHNLGLIGSLAIDPMLQPRDVDLVFRGNVATLNSAIQWVRLGARHDDSPLRYHPPYPIPTICAFFTASPPAYPDLTGLEVLKPIPQQFDLRIGPPLSPPYLNMQVYSARIIGDVLDSLLIVRDTLSRVGLNPSTSIHVSAYPATVRSKRAILITDVEKQLPSLCFHGGALVPEH